MKYAYKILILLLIFAGSLYYFGHNMVEAVFSIEKETMDMSETSLPYITFKVDDKDFNLLHGYCSGLDILTIRESITPLTAEQAFSIQITENESVVKKLKYEVTSLVDESTIEEGTINALDKEGEYKVARLKIKEPLVQNTEYVLKITLITDQSKRIYYYTRIKVLNKGYVSEKLDFVKDFHTSVLNKETAEEVAKYLETKKNADSTTFAYVNINSSLDMVSYGALNKEVVYAQVPTITEISNDQASVVLSFVLKVNTTSGVEYYDAREYYRFGYTTNRVYLYNYERTMESIFDVSLTSLSKSEFKLGITNNPELSFVTNSDKSIVAFVRNRELYSFSLSENKLVQVFSFAQEDTDYVRDSFDNHDIRIVSMDDSGNITFMVYGYMNRGEYEGRVAIILYTYDRVLGRIEEQMYIPINSTYEILKEEIGDFAYRNDYNVFYFSLYDTIYSYNFSTDVLRVIAENVPKSEIVFSKAYQYIAWQEFDEQLGSSSIHIFQLETGDETNITAKVGERIQIVGSIDNNIIYGLSKEADVSVRSDGTGYNPMYKIIISDFSGKILKSYEKDGVYTIAATVTENVIELQQSVKSDNNSLGYVNKEPDYILNRASAFSSEIGVKKRVTDLMLTEYYISLTDNYVMKELPEFAKTKNTVITNDTTVRVNRPNYYVSQFYAYSYGKVIMLTDIPGKAIPLADERVGVVINQSGQKVWERGAKSSKAQINGINSVFISEKYDSVQAAMKMLLSYKNVNVETAEYSKYQSTVTKYLSNNLKARVLDLKGATLDEVLYYVSNGSPVIAFKDEGRAVILTGYDSTTLTYIDPSEKRISTVNLKDISVKFETAGNVYISYIE